MNILSKLYDWQYPNDAVNLMFRSVKLMLQDNDY